MMYSGSISFLFIVLDTHPVDTFNQEVNVLDIYFLFSLIFRGSNLFLFIFFSLKWEELQVLCFFFFFSRSLFLAFWITLFLQLYPGFEEYKLSYLSAFRFRFQHLKYAKSVTTHASAFQLPKCCFFPLHLLCHVLLCHLLLFFLLLPFLPLLFPPSSFCT